MEKLFELFENTPRQGPGLDQTTLDIYRSIAANLPERPMILDMGCGTGTQTICLAKEATEATFVATDVHVPYLETLKQRAARAGVGDRITARVMSMMEPDIEPGSIDLIWSEGAIFIMGLEAGLRTWKPLLKSGGYAVVSECTWLKDNPPDEIREYWTNAYPKIADTETNVQRCRNAGYEVIETRVLESSGWIDNFFIPLAKRMDDLENVWQSEKEKEVLAEMRREIQLYRKYGQWYGYVFYILKVA